MGGRKELFGPVVREEHEPVFHERWEARVFGVMVNVTAVTGLGTEVARYGMNRLPPEVYLASYYQRWLGGFETVLTERGYLGAGEVDARMDGRPAVPGRKRMSRLRAELMARLLRTTLRPRLPRVVAGKLMPLALGTERPTRRRPRYAVGARVRVRDHKAAGHTRQPAYTSGKPGVVTAQLGATLFPDAIAVGRRERPQHLYTIAFEGRDLFGADAEPGTEVRVDLYENYLEPA
jgi:nitrile hydratase subunit beta